MICPITLEPMVEASINSRGSVYEYSAITQWFQQHETDPLTNLKCPHKFVVKFDVTSPYLKEKCSDIETNTRFCYPAVFAQEGAVRIYEKYSRMKLNIPETEWLEYVKKKREHFEHEKSPNRYIEDDECTELDIYHKALKIRDWDFVDLSKIRLWYKHFKCQKFIFSNLSGCVFKDCYFCHCTFIGCNLSDALFINCTFVGDNTCWYQSNRSNMKFATCKLEHINTWRMTSDRKEIAKILKERLVSGRIVDIDFGFPLIYVS